MEMMAWSLSNEERAEVRQYFIAMDANKHGTITLSELRDVLMDKFVIDSDEVMQIFQALDSNSDEEIHYSDFLAAMVSTRIGLHDDLLRDAFKRFDTDNSGYIEEHNLREVLGETFDGAEVDQLLREADVVDEGRLSYNDFVAYVRGTPSDKHADAASRIIDTELIKGAGDAVGRASMRHSMRPSIRPSVRMSKRPVPPKPAPSPARLSCCGCKVPACLVGPIRRMKVLWRRWARGGRAPQFQDQQMKGCGCSACCIQPPRCLVVRLRRLRVVWRRWRQRGRQPSPRRFPNGSG